MSKKLFKNYTYEFDKNEAKIISNFCKQAIKQMEDNSDFYKDVRAFESIMNKLDENPLEVKLTKDEKTRLVHQLTQNRDHLKKTLDKSGFIKKWFYKTLYTQYNNILTDKFND
jgi:hypothetical protein